MSQVLFDGYYGMQNIGDDVFCAVASAHARENWGIAMPGFTASPTFFPTVVGTPVLPARPAFRGQVRAAAVAHAIRRRHVVHAGGSTFHSMWGRFRDQARLHRLGLITLQAAGVSIGPFHSRAEGRRVGDFLRRFSSVTVRDKASLERLADIAPDVPATLVPDMALHYPGIAGIAPHRGKTGILGVTVARHESLRGGDIGVESRRLARVREIAGEYLKRSGGRLRVFSFNGHPGNGDDHTARTLFPGADVEHVGWCRDTAWFVRLLAECDLVIGIRLHGAVLASALGLPSVTVPYHAKCTEVLAGLSGCVVDSGQATIDDLLGAAHLPPQRTPGPSASPFAPALPH